MIQSADLLGGRFALGKPIGRGASGTVCRGLDTVSGEPVAIKILERADSVSVELMEAEAALFRGLSHPSIVRLHASGIHEGRPYLVTDYVAGGSLGDLLAREHRLPIWRALEIAASLAAALHHAHEHGVIHRDVKPSNILIASDGTPRLTDFGVATLVRTSTLAGRQGLVGTMAYMSPEGFRGEPLGPESDVWSLGLVVYEMLAGSLPFGVPATEAELAGLVDRAAPLIGEFRPDAPDALVSLLSSMLDRDRATRIGDAGDVARRLGQILAGLEAPGGASTAQGAGTEGTRAVPMPFLGREKELRAVLSLVQGGKERLVTLVGPGGIGKTRLAREAGVLAGEAFPDGVHLVPLAAIPSAVLTVPTIASAVGLTFRGSTDPKDQLLAFLKTRRVLLVLDNVEHLLEDAGLLEELLRAAAGLVLLVTSREPFRVPSETVMEIRGLGTPPSTEEADPGQYPAARLFAEAVGRAGEGFVPQSADWAAIAEICRLVEGNPLAIELAAASAGSRNCDEIARRVTEDIDHLAAAVPDLAPRHRSIRAVFDHSWNLLRESEQGVFRRMAVFHGGFTLEAARAVIGASLAVLFGLVRKSLLTHDGSDRCVLHELLRQYAREELERKPHELREVEGLHAEYYGRYVKERESALGAAKDTSAFLQIEPELPNLRRGWEHALATLDGRVVLTYLRGMHRFWEHRSRFREGEAAFADAVTRLRNAPTADGSCRKALAVALTCWSALIYRRARYEEARQVAIEARAMAEMLDLRVDAASAANTAGIASIALGDTAVARELITSALTTWENVGNLQGQGACHANLGNIAADLGHVEEAIAHYQRALAIFSQIDHTPGKATVLQNLTGMVLHRGDLNETRRLAHEALLLARSVGDRLNESRALATLGIVDQRVGDHEGAVSKYEKSIAIKRELGDRRGLANTLAHLGVSLSARGLHDCADAILEEAYDEASAIGDRHHQGMAMMFRADHALQIERSAEAERWYREAMVHALDTAALPQLTEIVRGVARLKHRFGDMAGALEAFLIGRSQPFYQEGWPSLDTAIGDLHQALSADTVAAVRAAVATETLENFARKLLAEPRWT